MSSTVLSYFRLCQAWRRIFLNHNVNLRPVVLPVTSKVLFSTQLFPKRKDSALSSIVSSQHSSSKKYRKFAEKLKLYLRLMRVDKPTGALLLFWPCTWSIALAAAPGVLPDVRLLALFAVGSFCMRSAACIVNDIIDKDYDRKVLRTSSRPLASGQISTMQATKVLAVLLSCSLSALLQLNWHSVLLGVSSLSLVTAYPYIKRFSYWPQLCLGITLNWGVLLAWVEVHNSYSSLLTVLPLYGACVCYTVIYDSIYSHQDKEDDVKVGVKSTALMFGDDTVLWLSGFATLMTGGLLYTGHICHQAWPFYAGVAVTALHVWWQVYKLIVHAYFKSTV
ncbi:unnamed protein product [Soboliphyme baturini]|uniref:4-hydroxybenzoate polyprenyltransferase, mitochondrial n=1 Tax=Soboliphyme baturini TaxID=241478 RepID=A0A183J5K9_9BILA|nr:unnamed protein product [Soboliphyme baturini]